MLHIDEVKHLLYFWQDGESKNVIRCARQKEKKEKKRRVWGCAKMLMWVKESNRYEKRWKLICKLVPSVWDFAMNFTETG